MVGDPDPTNCRVARSFGHVALRSCPDGIHVLDNGMPPFPAFGMDNNPRMFIDATLADACAYTVYELVESDRHVEDLFSGGW